MRERRGLPIAAHLGLLVALAFVSAFIGIVAVVIFLPPRQPDVMRTDLVAEPPVNVMSLSYWLRA